VRIIAPFAVRLKRIMEAEGGDEKNTTRILSRSARGSAGFLRSFFEVDWEDQRLYDLMVNAEKLAVETGINLIVESISSSEIQKGGKVNAARLTDLALTQKVEVTLMDIPGYGFGNLSVLIKEDVANLIGQVGSERLKEDVLRAVKKIEGVKEVVCQFNLVPSYYGP
jgi:hypothetical protein